MTLPPRNGMTSKSKSDAAGRAVVDSLAFSALFPAAIAFTFSLVSSHALNADPTSRETLHFAVLAAAGSFVVYGIDRLRDRQRDRQTSPLRTAFTDQYATAIVSATGLAGLILLISLATAPLRIGLLCAVVGGLGLLHRRLKTIASIKTLYVSLAWTAVCGGIPWLALDTTQREPRAAALLAAILFASIASNLIASNLRDNEAHLLRSEPRRVLILGRIVALAGLALAFAGPAPFLALAWIPAFELLALGFFRPTEHYGHLGVDGALLVGALASLVHQGLS